MLEYFGPTVVALLLFNLWIQGMDYWVRFIMLLIFTIVAFGAGVGYGEKEGKEKERMRRAEELKSQWDKGDMKITDEMADEHEKLVKKLRNRL